jgi:hypothetical protein
LAKFCAAYFVASHRGLEIDAMPVDLKSPLQLGEAKAPVAPDTSISIESAKSAAFIFRLLLFWNLLSAPGVSGSSLEHRRRRDVGMTSVGIQRQKPMIHITKFDLCAIPENRLPNSK